MGTLEEGRDTNTIDSEFLFVLCKSVYNWILGQPVPETLDVVGFIVHLKLKYHNKFDVLTKIRVDLFGAKRIYKALQHDEKEGEAKAMKINLASLIRYLKDMAIQPYASKEIRLGRTNRSGWSKYIQEQLPQIPWTTSSGYATWLC